MMQAKSWFEHHENGSLIFFRAYLVLHTLLCDDSDILTFSVNSQKAEKETRKNIQ